MPTTVSVNLIDHSGEPTRTKFYVETLDDTNYDALFDPITGSVSLLQAALLVATDCEHVSTVASVEMEPGTGVPPATVTAQREIAIRVSYRDTVNGRKGSFTVPGPITTFYPPTGVPDDIIPLDNVIFAALILVIEANAISRDDNPIEVVEGRLVGRNS
jgi:hypothetical protein